MVAPPASQMVLLMKRMCDNYCHADKDRQVARIQHQDKFVMHRCKQALPEQASGGATSM